MQYFSLVGKYLKNDRKRKYHKVGVLFNYLSVLNSCQNIHNLVQNVILHANLCIFCQNNPFIFVNVGCTGSKGSGENGVD